MSDDSRALTCQECGGLFFRHELTDDGYCKGCFRAKSVTDREECPWCRSRNVVQVGGSVSVVGGPLGVGYSCGDCDRTFSVRTRQAN